MTEVLPWNGLQSTLAASVAIADSTITIQAADASKWPSSATGAYRAVVCTDPNNGPWELMRVIGGQGTAVLTVTRAVESYNGDQTAKSWPSGAFVAAVVTHDSLQLAAGQAGYTVHEEFLPAAAATTITLSQNPGQGVGMLSRNGVVQSATDNDYSVAGTTVTFTTAFSGAERVVVTYTVGSMGSQGPPGPTITSFPAGTLAAPGWPVTGNVSTGVYSPAINQIALAAGGATTLILSTNTTEQRNGTNPQGSYVYNTWTNTSNYERGFTRWSSGIFEIGSEYAGSGVPHAVRVTVNGGGNLIFGTNFTDRWFIDGSTGALTSQHTNLVLTGTDPRSWGIPNYTFSVVTSTLFNFPSVGQDYYLNLTDVSGASVTNLVLTPSGSTTSSLTLMSTNDVANASFMSFDIFADGRITVGKNGTAGQQDFRISMGSVNPTLALSQWGNFSVVSGGYDGRTSILCGVQTRYYMPYQGNNASFWGIYVQDSLPGPNGTPTNVSNFTGIEVAVPSFNSGVAVGTRTGIQIDNQGGPAAAYAYGIYINPQSGATSANVGLYNAATSRLVGTIGAGTNGTVRTNIAFYLWQDFTTSSQSSYTLMDVEGQSSPTSSATGLFVGPQIYYAATTTLANNYGIYVASNNTVRTNTTNGYGIYVSNQSNGNVDHAYSLYVENTSGGNLDSYSIYAGGNTRIDGQLLFNVTQNYNWGPAIINIQMPYWGFGNQTTLYGIYAVPQFKSTGTSSASVFYAQLQTQAASYTLSNGYGLYVSNASIGGGSAITNLYGVYVANQGAAGITNAYGIWIAPQSNAVTTNIGLRVQGLYAAKFEGQVIIDNGFGFNYDATKGFITAFAIPGGPDVTGWYARLSGGKNASSSIWGLSPQVNVDGTGQPFTLNWVGGMQVLSLYGYAGGPPVGVTISNMAGIRVNNQAAGGGSGTNGPITTSYGIYIDSQGQGYTTNAYGLYIAAPSGATTLNIGLYNAGTTCLMGFVGIGSGPMTDRIMQVVQPTGMTGTAQYGIVLTAAFTSAATASGIQFWVQFATAAASFTMTSGFAIAVQPPALGAGSAVTSVYGVYVYNQGASGVTNTYGIYIALQAGSSSTNTGMYIAQNASALLIGGSGSVPTNTCSAGIVFYATTGAKIALYDAGGGTFYGLSVNPAEMTFNLPASSSSWTFRYGVSNGTAVSSCAGNGAWTGLSFTPSSSRDFKLNIVPLVDPIGTVLDDRVHGVSYEDSRFDNKPSVGFVADDWAEVVRDVVTFTEGKPVALDYDRIGAITFEALKQYITRTDARIAELEAKLAGAN